MRTLLLLFLSALLPAQVVSVVNSSGVPFDGWVRCVCDPVPPHRVGLATADDGQLVTYYVGRSTGREARAVDLKVFLGPTTRISVDLGKNSKQAPGDVVRPPLPADTYAWLGGGVALDGTQFTLISLDVDGAGYRSHLRVRTGRMLVTDLWTHWIPTQPYATAEVLVTASNPAVPDMGESVPADFKLQFGDALTVVPGRQAGAAIMDPGVYFADGQGRALPVTFVWPKHVNSPEGWATFGAMAGGYVQAIGVNRLLPQGNPLLPTAFDPEVWARGWVDEAHRRLHTFEAPVCGPAPFSGITGAQEDQTIKRGEPMLPRGEGAGWIAYLSALKAAARPCHHREESGVLVDIANHEQLAYWDGRPFFPHFPERLGKPRGLGMSEAHGWWGPDVEHTIYSTLYTICRLRDSSACQHLLASQALVYLSQWHVDRARYPNHAVPFAARATCWEGLLVQAVSENLTDRLLAQRVLDRGRARVQQIIVPEHGAKLDGVWDWRRDDRLGPGLRWTPWQQACGSYGLDVMSELLQLPEGRKLAHRAALTVLRDAYWRDAAGVWHVRDVVAADGAAVQSDSYYWFGSPMAIATVLRNDPSNAQAREIWKQIRAGATTVPDHAWLVPGVLQNRTK